jgi:mono/diheme cytochrome c family protein
MRRAIVAAALAATLFAGCVSRPGIVDSHFAGRSYAGDTTRGKLVFNTNCATCHGADGRSGGVGPPLIDESERQNLERTIVWIENPNPPMPRLYPSPLSERDVEDVAAFVQSIH